MQPSDDSQSHLSLSLVALCVLALLSAVAPIATDMYLPGFPQLVRDLNAEASSVQLTLTSFLVGLAVGQLVIGPLSDNYGRQKPLLIGTGLAIVSGVLCALTPSVEFLVLFRVLQGFGGAAGVVLARAIIADRAPDAATTARQTQIMMLIGGVAPILAPITGTFIVASAGWRAVFMVTALLSLISFFGVLRYVGESLAPGQRVRASRRALRLSVCKLACHRAYVGYTLVTGFSFMALFGYISASPFVFQNVLGLSPTAYSLVFGANAFGVILFGAISARLVMRYDPRRLIAVSLGILLLASVALLLCVLLHAGVLFMVPTIFFAVSTVGPIMGNASALAIRQVPDIAGAGSAVLGALQFALGAFASPLVGLLGENNPLPMAVVMLSAGFFALLCFYFLTSAPRAIEPCGGV
jgi:DHA1 family bicyclomycin/chloramphenicol resistance-like MFS transporter